MGKKKENHKEKQKQQIKVAVIMVLVNGVKKTELIKIEDELQVITMRKIERIEPFMKELAKIWKEKCKKY